MTAAHAAAAPGLRTAAALLVATILVIASVLAPPASARDLRLSVSQSETIQLDEPASSVFVADPAIADIQTPSPETVFVFGKGSGITTLTALDDAGNIILSRRIVVSRSGERLEDLLDRELPGFDIEAQTVDSGILLTGVVPSPRIAQKAVDLASTFLAGGGTVTNRLRVTGGLQVKLRVRVAEVRRDLSKQLGFNWDAVGSFGDFSLGLATGRTAINAAGDLVRAADGAGSLFARSSGSSGDISSTIDALAEDGLVTLLAEPSLTAVSGEQASFLAGGEFPIPIANDDGAFSVTYRKFGVSLQFVPTVLSQDRISMRVVPEVSELSTAGAIEFNGFSIPSISVRRAETTVELGSGQSFAIAGLISRTSETNVSKLPGLGDLPILGALFRSSSFQRSETELIIIVTPYIVRPISRPAAQIVPNDLIAPPSDLERILFGQLSGVGEPPRWRGPAGFVAE